MLRENLLVLNHREALHSDRLKKQPGYGSYRDSSEAYFDNWQKLYQE